jgi:PAS domain S-box-containing protein
MEGEMRLIDRYIENTLTKSDMSHPENLPRQWTRDIMQLLVIISILGMIAISVFIATGVLHFDEMFPVYLLVLLAIPFWSVSRDKHWKWARAFPAFICFALGAYGIYSLGIRFNIGLYFALAVLLAGLLQGIPIGLVYVVLGTAASVFFGAMLTETPSGFDLSSTIVISALTTFFCLLGVFLVQWYLKTRLEHLIKLEITQNNHLKEEIDLRHEAETARAAQEDQLKLSEEKFSKAFLISPDSVNINRLSDGVYIDINQGFTKLMGYTREDVLGKSSIDLNIWANPADRIRLVQGLMETGEVTNLEAKFIRKSGIISDALMSARILEINDEKCILSITRDISERKKQEEALRIAHADLEKAYDATLQGWVRALEMRERETANHSRRVVELTLQIAATLNINADEMIHIQRGALLHDIGKMGVPDDILLKPGPLTEDEWQIMRQHPLFAYTLLDKIDYLRPAIDIPYCHHEKWDGTGYPRRLKGEEIPLPARIFAIVDVYDALLSSRPYRPAWTDQQALEYLQKQSGTHFDPAMIEAFMNVNKAIYSVN